MNKILICPQKVTSAVFLFLMILSVITLCGQEKPRQPQVSFEVNVKLKLFDVLALDKDGKPVKDLKKEDFELFIGGKPWRIETFDVKDFSKSVVNAVHDSTAAPEYQAEMDDFFDKRMSILIFHELRIFKSPRENMAKGIFDFLDKNFTKDDLISIYYMKGSAILMLQPFTDDKQRIKDVIQYVLVDRKSKIPFNWPESSYTSIPRYDPITGKMVLIPIEGDTNVPWAAGNIEDFKREQPRLHGMKAATNILTSFHLFINSLSLFKGRKEIYMFSDSPVFSYYGYSGGGFSPLAFNNFKKLITDAMNNNVTINAIDMRRYGYQFNVGRIYTDTEGDFLAMGVKPVLHEFLQGLSTGTDGSYYWYCNRRGEITKRLTELSEKSSNVYYLGAYIQDLEPEEKYDIEIRTKREDIKLIYHDVFRTKPIYEEMDEVDRKLHFLEALYGSYVLRDYPFNSEVLQFPFGKEQTLVITMIKPETIEKSQSKFNAAVRYFNIKYEKDSQQVESWDVQDALAKWNIERIQILLGALVDDDSYYYRYVLRDSNTGAISNSRGEIKLGLAAKFLSSIVVFSEDPSVLTLSNLLSKKEPVEEDKDKSPEFVFDPELNPFIFNGKIAALSVNSTADASKPIFIMYMYNHEKTAEKSYAVSLSLRNEDGDVVPFDASSAYPEKEFPGGWIRTTLVIPENTLTKVNGKYTFKVEITDNNGKTIDMQERAFSFK